MRISHAGSANVSKCVATLGATAGDLSIACENLTGWPDGSIGPFYAALGKGSNTEEKVLCSGRAGNTLAVWTDGISNGRGADGTTIKEHPIGESIEHVWTAAEADAANMHIEEREGAHGFPPSSSLVTLTGAQNITGVKTMKSPILQTPQINSPEIDTPDVVGGTFAAPAITGGSVTDAAKVTLAGAQAPGEFRAREIFLSTGDPTAGDGEDGAVWIKYV